MGSGLKALLSHKNFSFRQVLVADGVGDGALGVL